MDFTERFNALILERALLVEELFREALTTVWDDTDAELSFEVSFATSPRGTLAALALDYNDVEVYGRELVRHATHHTLRVAPALLEEPFDIVWRVMLHEAIHVGYPRHDARFKKIAAAVGTSSTLRGIRELVNKHVDV